MLTDRLRRRLAGTARTVRRHVLPHLIPRAPRRRLEAMGPARVVGLLSSASGLGNSGRLCIEALEAAGVACQAIDVSAGFFAENGISFPRGTAGPRDADRGGDKSRPAIAPTIYHLNPPMLLRGLVASGLLAYYRAYNIGYWAWELETVPPEWIRAIGYVDAILVPSRFCAETLTRVTQKPVVVVPHPVPAGDEPATDRHASRPFTALGIFNYGSSFERKNPLAIVRAFRLAFPSGQPARLILKTSDGARHAGDALRLKREIADDARITLVDGVWTTEQMSEALASADAYISLHRSEGFGLTIAEAIMRGVPIVVTGWSGNLDFCDPDGAYLVGYDLVAFRDTHGDYAEIADARWAEPSVEHAAHLLRQISEHPDEARLRAVQCRRHLRAHLATSTYRRALEQLQSGDPRATGER
ncbi:MAG: glycosyltransferase [Hyphomicrobiaceae bacterium]|nr:glycosyltransferase [Hyphomicrobiaceae bacterium]